jgi:hypothetical protein
MRSSSLQSNPRPCSCSAVAGKGGGESTTNPDSSITIEDYSELWLGGTLGFKTNAVGLSGWQYPMFTVCCYQDLNGDGGTSGRTTAETSCTPRRGRRTRSSSPAAALRSGSRAVEDAECWAVLYAYGWKGGVESIRELASVGFHADG